MLDGKKCHSLHQATVYVKRGLGEIIKGQAQTKILIPYEVDRRSEKNQNRQEVVLRTEN